MRMGGFSNPRKQNVSDCGTVLLALVKKKKIPNRKLILKNLRMKNPQFFLHSAYENTLNPNFTEMCLFLS